MQRMTDMLPQGHCLSIMGSRQTSAMRLLNVPAACRSFRSDRSLSGALVVVVRLKPQVGALGTVVTFQWGLFHHGSCSWGQLY